MLRRLPIRLKLVLLAGVPVLGALILATLISRDAQRRAQSAAALGSIEDLARLSAHISKLVHELQFERSELGLRLGRRQPNATELPVRFERTDAASRELDAFLARHRATQLPTRLARDLSEARRQLERLPEERKAALAGEQDFTVWSERYQSADQSLISATAALAQLSDDGELMRAISALVSTMEIKERSSQEHALLSYVFAVGEFPPGTFKQFVTLTTQEADYVRVLEVNASDAIGRRFQDIWSGPERQRSAELRKIALETVEDALGVDPLEWDRVQRQKVDGLRRLEIELNEAVKRAAMVKVAAAQQALRISYGLGGSVIITSALLAGWIALGVSRSVRNLSSAAERVRTDGDFKVRALKSSDDELGQLTDAFNEMLAGIQARDAELGQHRDNLESLVKERTAELSRRNRAMRLVLDNVEQGLATIDLHGRLEGERSLVFDAWFEARGPDGLAERLSQGDAKLQSWLSNGWEQVTLGFLPVEAALDQLPRRIQVHGRHYELGYRPITEEGGGLRGVLLVVSDITAELLRLARDDEQREIIRTFEHLMRDRAGALEFLRESERLMAQVTGDDPRDRSAVLRALHTLKGNAGTFGVSSVAAAAHRLEARIIANPELPDPHELSELSAAWDAFSQRMARLLGTESEPMVEVAVAELQALTEAVERGAPRREISAMLARLELEPASARLRRVADQARSLAQRLGKPSVQVQIEVHGDVRFDQRIWAGFWAAFVHPIRNALGHGIEPDAERVAAGKPSFGTLRLVVRSEPTAITVELSDDGRGIDFEKVRAKAKVLGLAHATEDDLMAALFSDGFSTVEQATELAGRGVGMNALREAARSLGGVISLQSRRGQGTTLRIRFPAQPTAYSEALER
jgi:two-component system, chemotaxis family, sensor kinase CheA